MSEAIIIPRIIIERIKKEAEKLGVSIEEYIIELISQNLNPKNRAREYIEAAKELLIQSRKELEEGNIRQAAEKAWGASALAVKAYALLREGRRLSSHGELWEYSKILASEFGDWVFDAWAHANSMHTCFYEGWCTDKHVERALRVIEKLIISISERVLSGLR